MVLIGIDFGSDSCVVTTVIGRRLEALIHDYKDRKIPSIVSFGDRKREIGAAAKKFLTTNIQNTIYAFKQYLMLPDHKNNDAPYTVDYTTVFSVNHLQEGRVFDVIQVTSMLFAKIKTDANISLKPDEVTGCVLSIPSYFNEQGQKALLLAAAIAGLDCHFLIKETTAVSINYFFYKKFSSPINVVFVDFGHSSIQIFACKFSEKQIEIVAEVSKLIGGRDIDKCLADYIIENFKELGVSRNQKNVYAQLLNEIEQFKMKLGSNTGKMTLNLKNAENDQPIEIFMERSEMEKICQHLFDEIEPLLHECLSQSELMAEDIQSIELVGGSSRIPIVQDIVHKVFGKTPVATMNRDEAVSRGCFLKSRIAKVRKDVVIIEKSMNPDIVLEIDGLMAIEQVHPNFRGDGKSCLNIDKEKFQHYLSIEKSLDDSDEREIARRNKRNQLEEFVIREISFISTFVSSNKMEELGNIKYWHNGNFDDYSTYLTNLTQSVKNEKDKIRLDKFQELRNFIHAHSEIIQLGDNQFMTELNKIDSWTDGKTEEYAAKLENIKTYVVKETERQSRKKELIDLVEKELKPGGNLNNYINKGELKDIRNLNNATTEAYLEQYNTLKKYAEIEKDRKRAKMELLSSIDEVTSSGVMLTDHESKHLEELKKIKNGTIEQYNNECEGIATLLNTKRESLRVEHRTYLFDLIEKELKPGGMLYEINENINWLSVKRCLDESAEYYVEKHKELLKYVANEKHRRTEREKLFAAIRKEVEPEETLCEIGEKRSSWLSVLNLVNETVGYYRETFKEFQTYIKNEKLRRTERGILFDLIKKEAERGGTLHQIDENIRRTWMSEFELYNESIEYYIIKRNEFTQFVIDEGTRRTARDELLSYIQILETRYGTSENKSHYLAQLNEIKLQYCDAVEDHQTMMKNLKRQIESWKLPLLAKTTSMKHDKEIGELMIQIRKHKPLVEILQGIRSMMSIEVCFYEKIILDEADINQYISRILQSVKSFANSWCTWTWLFNGEISKIRKMYENLQSMFSKIELKNL